MKYILLALMLIFTASVSAETYFTTNEKEANARLQKFADELVKNPPKYNSAAEYNRACIEWLGPVEKQHAYYGDGIDLSDREVYIDGKKYHCVEYESNTQCHID